MNRWKCARLGGIIGCDWIVTSRQQDRNATNIGNL